MTLFWQQFKSQFTGLMIWLLISVALVLMINQSADSFVAGDAVVKYMESLPPSLRSMVGLEVGMAPLDIFVAAQVSKSLGLVSVLYTVLLALNVITREMDRRTIDFLLALPVGRSAVLLARTAVMLLNSALLTGAVAVSLEFSFRSSGLEGNWAGYRLIFLNIWLLAVALGSVTLLASLWIDDYGLGVKLMLGLASGTYFLEFVLRAAQVSRAGRWLSPFSYLDANAILKAGSLPVTDTLVLVATTLLCIGLSLPLFERKQITA